MIGQVLTVLSLTGRERSNEVKSRLGAKHPGIDLPFIVIAHVQRNYGIKRGKDE